LLTDSHAIREVILFPLLRAETAAESANAGSDSESSQEQERK